MEGREAIRIERRDDEGKTNLDLIEAMENQNKQILLKLSPSLSSLRIVLLVPSQIRIAIDSQNEQETPNFRVWSLFWLVYLT